MEAVETATLPRWPVFNFSHNILYVKQLLAQHMPNKKATPNTRFGRSHHKKPPDPFGFFSKHETLALTGQTG